MTEPGPDGDPRLAALRAQGAQHVDPVRFRYIEALARRAVAHGGEVRRLLDDKLARALTAYGGQVEQARTEAGQTLTRLAQRFPDAAGDLHRLHADGEFGGLRRREAQLEARSRRGPLADLLRHIDRHVPQQVEAAAALAPASPLGQPVELKALWQFRSTWTRLSADRQLARSLAEVPRNPGPLNSHLLALRSLQLMQALSPAYLQRFMTQIEALLWLEQASTGHAALPAKAVRREGDKPRKSGRSDAGRSPSGRRT